MHVKVRGRILVQNSGYYLLHENVLYYISDIDVRRCNLDFKLISILQGLDAYAVISYHFSEIQTNSLELID